MYEAVDIDRLDLFIMLAIEANGLPFVSDNYIELRNEYYESKNGG